MEINPNRIIAERLERKMFEREPPKIKKVPSRLKNPTIDIILIIAIFLAVTALILFMFISGVG